MQESVGEADGGQFFRRDAGESDGGEPDRDTRLRCVDGKMDESEAQRAESEDRGEHQSARASTGVFQAGEDLEGIAERAGRGVI